MIGQDGDRLSRREDSDCLRGRRDSRHIAEKADRPFFRRNIDGVAEWDKGRGTDEELFKLRGIIDAAGTGQAQRAFGREDSIHSIH